MKFKRPTPHQQVSCERSKMAFPFAVPLYFISSVGSGAHRSPTVFASVFISDVISGQS